MEINFAIYSDIERLDQYDPHISREELENAVYLKRVYIARENEKIIGWLRYNLFWDNTPFMNLLYVLEEYRGKGVGRQLVIFWERRMQEQRYKFLMTSSQSDEYAQHFYIKLGYQAIGGFRLGEDPYEIIFAKRLIE